jgi:hypothetical protein
MCAQICARRTKHRPSRIRLPCSQPGREDVGMKVVLIAPLYLERVTEIQAVDARIQVIDAWERFGPAPVPDWPESCAAAVPPTFLHCSCRLTVTRIAG